MRGAKRRRCWGLPDACTLMGLAWVAEGQWNTSGVNWDVRKTNHNPSYILQYTRPYNKDSCTPCTLSTIQIMIETTILICISLVYRARLLYSLHLEPTNGSFFGFYFSFFLHIIPMCLGNTYHTHAYFWELKKVSTPLCVLLPTK